MVEKLVTVSVVLGAEGELARKLSGLRVKYGFASDGDVIRVLVRVVDEEAVRLEVERSRVEAERRDVGRGLG